MNLLPAVKDITALWILTSANKGQKERKKLRKTRGHSFNSMWKLLPSFSGSLTRIPVHFVSCKFTDLDRAMGSGYLNMSEEIAGVVRPRLWWLLFPSLKSPGFSPAQSLTRAGCSGMSSAVLQPPSMCSPHAKCTAGSFTGRVSFDVWLMASHSHYFTKLVDRKNCFWTRSLPHKTKTECRK